MQERLKCEHSIGSYRGCGVVYGRALLANGRPQEAIKPLRLAYGSMLGSDSPRGECAAGAEYWLGRDYIARGHARRARWMVTEAQRTLASPKLKSHLRPALESH